jgi:hypothetical protein
MLFGRTSSKEETKPKEQKEFLPGPCQHCYAAPPDGCKKKAKFIFCGASASAEGSPQWISRAEAGECPGAARRSAFLSLPPDQSG